MTEGPEVQNSNKGVNPIIAIGAAVIIAMLLAGASLIIFLGSNTREVINIKEDSLNTGEAVLPEQADEASSLTSDSLDDIEAGIKNTVSDINTDDFGSSEMTDAALGL